MSIDGNIATISPSKNCCVIDRPGSWLRNAIEIPHRFVARL
jgi:hypothetical protein